MKSFITITIAFIMTSVSVYAQNKSTAAESTSEVVLTSEVEWGPLNAARGDQSPRAGTLWGDRTASGASGFLVKFTEGFSSPPHIHNVTYRGVVISGLIHNDDPSAENMWMPAGSFWTQPAGEGHITAAKGSNNMAYIEIEEGPYLVQPTEKAFDNGERPINVYKSNIVWVDASDIKWIDQPGTTASGNGVKVAFLWGNLQEDELSGTLLKLPAGITGELRSNGSPLRAVIIQGQPQYQGPSKNEVKNLEPGSYFGSEGATVHQVSSEAGEESIIYIRTDGKFNIITTQPKK